MSLGQTQPAKSQGVKVATQCAFISSHVKREQKEQTNL